MQHDWVPSTLGHGNVMCRVCKVTDLEARAIGVFDECRGVPNDAMEKTRRAEELVERIGSLLHGQGPDVQGAVLADLVAIWLAGHHPNERKSALVRLLASLPSLTEINERIIFGPDGFPEGSMQ